MYLGLLNLDHREPDGDGYHRVYIGRHDFNISPGMKTITFVNTVPIAFSRTTKAWGQMRWIAIFDDAYGVQPRMLIRMQRDVFIAAGLVASLEPGQLEIELTSISPSNAG
jgi:hypothetical protein